MLGISVINVTAGQVRGTSELEWLAKFVAKKVGKQLQYKNPQFKKAQQELRSMLL